MEEDTFRTLIKASEGFYREKGSKFLAFAYPCDQESVAKSHIERLRKEHHNACHVCFAWRFGTTRHFDRYSDDGEPSNSAGKPIFGQIQSFELTNVLIAVVRYYGGTNLGVGGLINAYKTAAKEALESGQTEERHITTTFKLKHTYNSTGIVMQLISQVKGDIIEQGYEAPLPFIICQVRQSLTEKFEETIKNTKDITAETWT